MDNTPLDIAGSAVYLAFTVLALLPDDHLRNPIRSTQVRYIVRSTMPLFLLLAVFALATRLAMMHLTAGLACMGVAILGYGVRHSITQSQYMQARDQMEELTMIDELTQIMNRRGCDYALTGEWQRAQRNRDSLALLLLDIDHFKQFNDTHGHQQGDARLVSVAHCIRDTLTRGPDHVFRYGGEEFIVILPQTRLDGALLVAERIRQAVMDLAVTDQRAGSESEIPLTVSIGVVAHEPYASLYTASNMITSADQALYSAKRAGRNCVRHAPLTASLVV